jgi:hypothetical protein
MDGLVPVRELTIIPRCVYSLTNASDALSYEFIFQVRGGGVAALFFLPAGRISYKATPNDPQPIYV